MSKLKVNSKNQNINLVTKFRRLLTFLFFIITYSIFITGSTYAYKYFSDTNNVASGTAGCFQVNYTGQNLDAGNILSTNNYLDGAHTTVTLSKDSSCKIYTNANIVLHTNETTTAPIATVQALRYKILSGESQISEGFISSKGDFILATVPITDTATTYTIYLWIDSDLSGGSYHSTTYSGYIYAESAQTSTIEHQYLVSFNTNGGAKLNPKIVTYGSTYGNLPQPTKSGYTFAGWSLVPSEYQQVEYLESNGAQYIDTGLSPNMYSGNYAVEIEELHDISANDRYIFGTNAGTSAAASRANIKIISNGLGCAGYLNNQSGSATGVNRNGLELNNKNYIKFTVNSQNQTASLTVNSGTSSLTNTTFISTSTSTFKIFRLAGVDNAFIGKIYSTKLYGNEKMVGNYIPCYKKTDAEHPGMYDTVTGKFYKNEGTGNFTAGTNRYITNSSTVTQENNHTLYAVWQ